MLKLIRSAAPMANRLVAISLVLLLLKLFCFNQITELFNFGYQLGLVVDGILLSVISSYIFYLFVVHQKEIRDKENITPYIEKHILSIIGICSAQVNSIAKESAISLNIESLDKSLLNQAMTRIDPNAKAPLMIAINPEQYASWLQFFDHHKYRTQEIIKRLFVQLPFLDTELIVALTNIDECIHFMALAGTVRWPVRNTNLEAWSESFYDYCELCIKLQKLLKRETLS